MNNTCDTPAGLETLSATHLHDDQRPIVLNGGTPQKICEDIGLQVLSERMADGWTKKNRCFWVFLRKMGRLYYIRNEMWLTTGHESRKGNMQKWHQKWLSKSGCCSYLQKKVNCTRGFPSLDLALYIPSTLSWENDQISLRGNAVEKTAANEPSQQRGNGQFPFFSDVCSFSNVFSVGLQKWGNTGTLVHWEKWLDFAHRMFPHQGGAFCPIWRCPQILLPQSREFSHNNQSWMISGHLHDTGKQSECLLPHRPTHCRP